MIEAVADPLPWILLTVATLILLLGFLRHIEVPTSAWHDRLRERFVLGVPWGTLVVAGALVIVYLFVQRGFWHPYHPVVAPYTSMSIRAPLGWLLAAFSHADPGHLRGNLITLVVFGPMVEWSWGHYASTEQSWRSRPLVRAVVLFPLGIAALGIVAALFSWGPVIGFSIVAYALIGIVLVRYPLLALLGLLSRAAVRVGVRSLRDPVEFGSPTVSVVEPGWYGSAVQGHLLGLLVGVVVGCWLLSRTGGSRPARSRLFGAALLVGAYQSLWTIWWVTGPEEYVLFRAAGVVLVVVVAMALTLAAAGRDPDTRRRATAVIVAAIL